MRKICDLPYGLELLVDQSDCSPMLRRGRRFTCRPHERTDDKETKAIAAHLEQVEKVARARGDSLAVAGIVNARVAMDREMRERLQRAKEVHI